MEYKDNCAARRNRGYCFIEGEVCTHPRKENCPTYRARIMPARKPDVAKPGNARPQAEIRGFDF